MAGIEKSIYGDNKRTTIYYALPFASYERGSNENANKLIRTFIKKGDNIGKFSRKDIKYIYKTGLIIILENYLIISRLTIYFMRI